MHSTHNFSKFPYIVLSSPLSMSMISSSHKGNRRQTKSGLCPSSKVKKILDFFQAQEAISKCSADIYVAPDKLQQLVQCSQADRGMKGAMRNSRTGQCPQKTKFPLFHYSRGKHCVGFFYPQDIFQ